VWATLVHAEPMAVEPALATYGTAKAETAAQDFPVSVHAHDRLLTKYHRMPALPLKRFGKVAGIV
jgi:hypothetical protein